MNKTGSTFSFREIPAFLKSRLFRYTLLRLFLFLILLWIIQTLILQIYTNHGQRLKLGNFVGLLIDKAHKNAYSKGFEIVVTDSIHMIGKPGGMVLSQVPKAGSYVKRGRKVYVTLTRFNADQISSEVLISCYGKKYQHKKAELFNLYELKSKIRSTEYDPGPAGHILKVYYKDELIVDKSMQNEGIMIPKGETLEFVVSSESGGTVEIPNLICKNFLEAQFELDAAGLKLGQVEVDSEITDRDSSYVVKQFPLSKQGATIRMGEAIDLIISKNKPSDCD